MTRFFYAYGYMTREAAYEAMIDCFADGSISEAEKPEVKRYLTKKGTVRWGVEVNG